LSEKLGPKLRGKNFRLVDAFAGILQLEASPVEGQQLQQKIIRKGEKKKTEKNPKFFICAQNNNPLSK